MAIVTRYSIERLTEDGPEYWDGHYWSELREDAEEYRTIAAADEDAAEHGGEVFRFQRLSNIPDAYAAPIITLIAAE